MRSEAEGPENDAIGEEWKIILNITNSGKDCGAPEVNVDLLKVLGECGINWLRDVIKDSRFRENLPDGWTKSDMVPIYKPKRDVMEPG